MAIGSPRKRSVNYDINKIIKNYFKLSSIEEIRHDVVIPFIIATISVLFLFIGELNLLEVLTELNSVIITVMSILAGFNTASIAIISSSNPLGFVERLESEGKEEGERLLEGLTCYFSYAIILQLFILIISIVASVALKFFSFESIMGNNYLVISLALIFILWFTLMLNSLFITLRNAAILHNFILYLAKKS